MEFVVEDKTWMIKFVPADWNGFIRKDGSRTCGLTDKKTNSVYISQDIRGRFLNKVICHELCHVYCATYGIKLSRKTEEIVADFVSSYGKSIADKAERIKEIYEYGFERFEQDFA